MIPGSYQIDVSFFGIAHFKNVLGNLQYWVAIEPKYTVKPGE
jgi:hypothetical protein